MKKIIVLFFMLFCLFVYSNDVTDDNTIRLDIDTAVSKAMDHSFSLKNSVLDYKAGKFSVSTSWNKIIPNTSLSASIGKGEGSVFGEVENRDSLSFGVKTSLSLSANLVFDIYQTTLDWQNGLLSLKQAQYQLKNDIKKYYYNLIILKEQFELKKNLVENAKTRFDVAVLKYNTGSFSEIDKLKSEYDYKSLIYDMNQLENSYQTSLMQFEQLLGIDENSNLELTSSIPEINESVYEDYKNINIDRNLDLQLLVQKLKSAENSRNGYIASLTPTLGISYSFSSSFNKDPYKDQWFNDIRHDWNYSNGFSLSIGFPLDNYFPFSSMQMQLINGQYEIQKIKNDIEDQKEKTLINVKTILMNLKEIDSDINSLKLNLEIAQKTYQMVAKLYNSGSKNFLDLKDAENNYIDAKIKLLTANYNYLTNTLDLKYTLNIDDNIKGGE